MSSKQSACLFLTLATSEYPTCQVHRGSQLPPFSSSDTRVELSPVQPHPRDRNSPVSLATWCFLSWLTVTLLTSFLPCLLPSCVKRTPGGSPTRKLSFLQIHSVSLACTDFPVCSSHALQLPNLECTFIGFQYTHSYDYIIKVEGFRFSKNNAQFFSGVSLSPRPLNSFAFFESTCSFLPEMFKSTGILIGITLNL